MKKFFITLWMILALTANSQAWDSMAWDLSTKYAGVVRKTAAPTATDSAYKIGTIWINTSTEDVYILADNTSAAAVWTGTRQVKAQAPTELLTWGAAAWNEDGSTWTFASSTLTHVTGNTTTVTGTLTGALTAGVTYVVTITGTGGGATATYTVGGVTGTTIAASGAIAIEDYITATADSELVITPASTCTVALTLVSVKALTGATGDVTIDGNLNVRSPAYFHGRIYGNPANDVLSLGRLTLSDGTNADGIVFGSLGTSTKGIDLSGSGLSGATDYWIYNSASSFWSASNLISAATLRVGGGACDYDQDTTGYSGKIIPTRNLLLHTPALVGGVLSGNATQVGNYSTVTFPTANKDYANKTGIGTASAVGEDLMVVGGTGATTGTYRIITIVGADSVQVDRNIHAAGSDITNGSVVIYKDVVGIFPTDGTNGQRIMNYSAQNKPLQLGGDVLTATTNLTSEDILIGANLGLSQTQAAGAQAGTIANVQTVGNPGIFFKVYDTSGNAWAVPGWAIP